MYPNWDCIHNNIGSRDEKPDSSSHLRNNCVDYKFILFSQLFIKIIVYTFRAEQEFPATWMVEQSLIWRYIHREWRWIFLSLVIKLVIFVISASKLEGQLLNEFFIYSEDIIPSQGYLKGENFQNDRCRPWTKSPFKNSYSRQFKRIVDRQQVTIDRTEVIYC